MKCFLYSTILCRYLCQYLNICPTWVCFLFGMFSFFYNVIFIKVNYNSLKKSICQETKLKKKRESHKTDAGIVLLYIPAIVFFIRNHNPHLLWHSGSSYMYNMDKVITPWIFPSVHYVASSKVWKEIDNYFISLQMLCISKAQIMPLLI